MEKSIGKERKSCSNELLERGETIFSGKLKIHNASDEGVGLGLRFYASQRAFNIVLWRALEGFYY